MSTQPNPITEWIRAIIDQRIDERADEFVDDSSSDTGDTVQVSPSDVREIVRDVLVTEAVVHYGGEIGLQTFEESTSTDSTESTSTDDLDEEPA